MQIKAKRTRPDSVYQHKQGESRHGSTNTNGSSGYKRAQAGTKGVWGGTKERRRVQTSTGEYKRAQEGTNECGGVRTSMGEYEQVWGSPNGCRGVRMSAGECKRVQGSTNECRGV